MCGTSGKDSASFGSELEMANIELVGGPKDGEHQSCRGARFEIVGQFCIDPSEKIKFSFLHDASKFKLIKGRYEMRLDRDGSPVTRDGFILFDWKGWGK